MRVENNKVIIEDAEVVDYLNHEASDEFILYLEKHTKSLCSLNRNKKDDTSTTSDVMMRIMENNHRDLVLIW